MHDFKAIEERILKFWEDHNVFRRSVEARKHGKPFVFYEGPPTANAAPAIHHFIGRAFKDVIPRYQTMRGRYVSRKGGWDTHGLPVELQVEKALGFKNKKDIEAYGIAQFNALCRESVWKNKEEWGKFTRRIGYWVDLQDPYITYDNSYIESLWNIIRNFWDKKLLYQAHRVVPFCTRCGTPLSSHEVAQGYKTVTDTAVTVKFKVLSSKLKGGRKTLPKGTSILAWTTTPWTLPGNVALAVGRDIRYVLAKKGDEHFIVAEELANTVLGAPLAILDIFSGSDLVGISYQPLFSVKKLKKSSSYKVYDADFVTITDGTGVVHTAVMYGEDDYRLGDKLKLVKHHTVTEQGVFTGVSQELDGRYVKSSATEQLILDHLRAHDSLLATSAYEHEYPFCWRCDTPLLYYAKDSWFVRMSALNTQLLANNETVNWVPAHLKHGRFGQWLREGKDWAFSRERYWGTPLPVWMSRDKKQTLVAASLDDLDAHRGDNPATFWVMRHGEAESNVQHIISDQDGHTDAPLTEQGRVQAIEAGKALKTAFKKKRIRCAAIIASPFQRTADTAKLAAKEMGIKKVLFDERLKEIQLGPSLTGCHDSEYHQRYPSYEQKFAQRPPGGESLADLRERMWGVVQDLNAKYAGKHVLLVFHEYPIWMFADAANGWSMKQSIEEKERRGKDFVTFAEPEQVVMRNLPRDEKGNVDMHRPSIDSIVLKRGRTLLHRVPELCDVWFDSGAMPFAQWHWPFENDATLKAQFPADFIAEAIDQTRGWFYTLLAVSTALGMGAPYRNVLSYSHVLDEKGQKMSKSKGNIVAPDQVIDAVGIDATRWYFYTVNNPGDSKMFSMSDVRERLTGFMGTLANCMRFYDLYRAEIPSSKLQVASLLDRWILSRLAGVQTTVTDRLDGYDLTGATRAIEQFVIDDFSQWWLRRSRKRSDALGLLRHLLRHIALLTAPFIPFMADDLWQKLREPGDPDSVHLADWPKSDSAMIDHELEERMIRVREYISQGLALRKQGGIKVRQPLAALTVPGTRFAPDLETLIREELNVQEVRYESSGDSVVLDTVISPALRAEGWAREAMRTIQEMRRDAGCRVADRVACQWNSNDPDVAAAIEMHAAAIRQETGLSSLVRQSDGASADVEREFELEPGKRLQLGIHR
jgi:isoleucyl-tRNA synthetase